MPRALSSWVDSFCQFGKPFNTTSLFLEWGAIWQLSTAIGRQAGTQLRGQLLTPNMFVMLVAGPGAGKSQAISAIRKVLIPATNISTIPSSVTRAGLQDYMAENLQKRTNADGSILLSHECIALSEEMQGILPEHDIGHLTLYNELYDARSIYKARTRSNGQIDLQAPFCSIITGAQPAFLATTLPEQAWGMGFMSRTILVFGQAATRTSAFLSEGLDHALLTKLIMDLKQVHNLHGYFQWDDGARALYEAWWVDRGGPPVPGSKRLAMGYNARRDLHFFKLAMCYSLSRSNDLIVTLEDTQKAVALLLRTEERMKMIFTEMTNTGTSVVIEEILDTVRLQSAEGKTVQEATIIHMLMERVPNTQVNAMVDNLINSGMLKIASKGIAARGFRHFVAGDKMSLV